MLHRFRAGILVLAVTGAVAAPAATRGSMGYQLSLSVPTLCSVRHHPGLSLTGANEYGLGSLQEYCNAPRGYKVDVRYTPGALRGAVVAVGEDRVVLDGSGTATISVARGPAIRERSLKAIPGSAGFDTDRLDFAIAPL